MAQLAEQSPLTPRIRESNPAIVKKVLSKIHQPKLHIKKKFRKRDKALKTLNYSLDSGLIVTSDLMEFT